jgi:hypothetical protein
MNFHKHFCLSSCILKMLLLQKYRLGFLLFKIIKWTIQYCLRILRRMIRFNLKMSII